MKILISTLHLERMLEKMDSNILLLKDKET